MSNYWAKFEDINGDTYRFDTRIYLNGKDHPNESDICLGAIVAKNPGSAIGPVKHQNLQIIKLNGDKLLPTVRNIFIKSCQGADINIPENSYIQVLNLFYLCEKDLNIAVSKVKESNSYKSCSTEKKVFPFVWFLWGGDDKVLNMFKTRFDSIKTECPFYYDKLTKEIVSKNPAKEVNSFPKHTQGLRHGLITPYLTGMLCGKSYDE